MLCTIRPCPVVFAATLLLTANGLHAQVKERNVGNHNVSPEYRGQTRGVVGSEFELRTSVVPESATPPSGTVSVEELRLPTKATKEFALSMKSFEAGDYRATAEHLKRAAKIAPDFVQAHHNLGVIYINLKQYEAAIAELHKTIELNPNLEAPYHNLSIVLILLNRLPEAEYAARHALDLSPNLSATQFTLGRILALQKRYTMEAIQLLTAASAETPAARLVLANVLQNRGELDPAMVALRTYLKNPDPAKKPLVEKWLGQLEIQAKRAAELDIAALPLHRVDP